MLTLKAYDSTLKSDFIELPRIEQIILDFPFCKTASFEDLYEYGNEDLKYILDKVPLHNKHRYVTVNMEVQFLFANKTTAPRSNWHFDGSSFLDEDKTYTHILSSDCYSRTEFLNEEIKLDNFNMDAGVMDVEVFMNRNLHLLSPKKMESNRFITFNESHLHRPSRSIGTEFRFFLRILESDYLQPRKFQEALMQQTRVFDDQLYTNEDYRTYVNYDYIHSNEIKNELFGIRKISESQILLNIP